MKESGDFAVWGICISGLKGLDSMPKLQEFRSADKDERKGLVGPLLDEVFSKQADTAENAAEQWGAANAILSESKVMEHEKNIYYVYPRWHNGRASAQSGLFLMPSHIAIPFDDILMGLCSGGMANSSLARDVINNEQLGMAEIFARLNVVKFTFSAKLRDEVHRLLKLMDKNPRTIYPDVDGLAKSLANPFKSL